MKRGRRSAAELAVIPTAEQRIAPAPAELSDAQAQVWRDVVSAMPEKWLHRAAYPILIAYCRHVCRARLLESMIGQFQPEWVRVEGGVERLNKLLAAAERETKAVVACARSLRISPSSAIQPRTAGRLLQATPAGAVKPWD